MQIGEFAKLCNTKLSVLRYYDKEGLLVPEYIDRFTGYRYYSNEQIAAFNKISALKKADFSLAEIRSILKSTQTPEDIMQLLEKKKNNLNNLLQNLEEAKKIMLGVETMNTTIAHETRLIELHENINLPFENDESIIGKWKILGEYACQEDFFADKELHQADSFYNCVKEIYFLPNGENYWCYGWTKGKLLVETGDSSSVNEYVTEQHDEHTYMFIQLKSYTYRCTGTPTTLVLQQLNHVAYTAQEIARKDNIAMPFVPDERILGKWKVHSYCPSITDFDSKKMADTPLYFSSIEFMKGGHCTSTYGDDIIFGDDIQVWTRGYVLRKWNSTACAYEIKTIDNTEYLIIEWKSGDYRWGGFDTDYYVFIRES